MATQNPFEAPLKSLQQRIAAAKPVILQKMGAAAMLFIDENFRRQGFQGSIFEAWAPRKNDKKSKGRNILVLSGHLKNSWRYIASFDSVTIANSLPYARIHNEGGSINHPERTGTLSFGFNKKGGLKLAKVQTVAQQKRVKAMWRGTIGEHDTNMPQRRMIGYSPVLNKDIYNIIWAEILPPKR